MHRVEAIAQGLLHKLMLACVGVGEEAARQRRLILAAPRRMLHAVMRKSAAGR